MRIQNVLSLSLASAAIFLSGCGFIPTASESGPVSEAATISGAVHGGQQPVFNATVRLYASGTTGYGTGSTLLATSLPSSAGAGSFSFTKLPTTGPVINSALPVYQCPATGNPIIYITAVGGNTQGTTDTAVNNSASALMAVLGPCSTVSGNAFVSLNEISTVASVFAMAPYINPGTTTPGSITVGTAATTQASVGINNAVSSIANLASISGGNIITPPQYTGTSASTSAVTVTATAESAKIATIANILAACINTPSAASTQCTDLFTNANPPLSAAYTSQPSATFATAVDTLQAAYYMATNPASIGTFTSCSGGSTTTMACLFNLASATAPFGGGLTAQPSDWTIGVTYSSTGNCAGTGNGPFIQGAFRGAIDASGNVWFVGANSNATVGQNISEMSPVGQPLLCLGNLSGGRSITIDPTGNVWASFNGSGTTLDVQELPVGGSALITWPTTAVGVSSYGLASDGVGNIDFTATGNGGFLYRFAAPGTSTTPTTPTQVLGPLATSGANNVANIAFDPSENAWIVGTTNGSIYNSYTASDAGLTAAITAFSTAHTGSNAYSLATFTTSSQAPFTAGQQVTLSGFTSANATTLALNTQKVYVASVSATSFTANVVTSTTQASVTSTTDAGIATASTLDSVATTVTATPYGLALDNAGNAYSGSTCCGTTSTYKTLTKLLPPATPGAAATVTRSAQYIGGINGVRSVALDGAGNMWIGNEYSSVGDISSTTFFPIAEVATSTSGTTTIFTALSPTGTALSTTLCTTSVGCPTGGGFLKSDVQEARDIAVDPSGNVWVLNTGNEIAACSTYCGTTIVQIVGAAVPVVTPLSVGVGTTKLATKP